MMKFLTQPYTVGTKTSVYNHISIYFDRLVYEIVYSLITCHVSESYGLCSIYSLKLETMTEMLVTAYETA